MNEAIVSVSARRISKGFACVCVFDTRSHDKPREDDDDAYVGGWFSFSRKRTRHIIASCGVCVRDRSSASRRVEARVRESCVEPKPPWVQVSSRPGARRATRLRARSLGTGRDPRASPPPIPASGNGKPREAVSRAVSTARSPREHGAAATGSVRAPLETERAGFRSDVPSVTTSRRVFEVASGSCRGRGWAFERDISAIGSGELRIAVLRDYERSHFSAL